MTARGGNRCTPLLHNINKEEVTVTPSLKKADNVLMVEWVYKVTQSHECCQPSYSSKTKSLQDTCSPRAHQSFTDELVGM